MTTKEIINKTFDKVIEKIKKERIVGAHYDTQVYDETLDIQTDKNITKICQDKIGWNNSGMRRVSEVLKAPLKEIRKENLK